MPVALSRFALDEAIRLVLGTEPVHNDIVTAMLCNCLQNC